MIIYDYMSIQYSQFSRLYTGILWINITITIIYAMQATKSYRRPYKPHIYQPSDTHAVHAQTFMPTV